MIDPRQMQMDPSMFFQEEEEVEEGARGMAIQDAASQLGLMDEDKMQAQQDLENFGVADRISDPEKTQMELALTQKAIQWRESVESTQETKRMSNAGKRGLDKP